MQIAKFVRWAASAHSWYKHVPLQEAAVFCFVLDLTVGMRRTANGFAEQFDGDVRTHYSWLPTKAYREAFGLLTYRDALPAFQPKTRGPRSVSVQKIDAERVWIPAHLVKAGSCHVTAACHGRAESYQIYHHCYEAFVQASRDGTLGALPKVGQLSSDEADEPTRHTYSYLPKQEQMAHFRSLPPGDCSPRTDTHLRLTPRHVPPLTMRRPLYPHYPPPLQRAPTRLMQRL